MKNKNVLYEFDLSIYPRRVWVCVSCTDDFLRQHFQEVIQMSDDCDACVCNAATKKPNVLGGVLIRFANYNSLTVSNIAHESAHAALCVFDYVECRVDYENQEPFAYLVGAVANYCNQIKSRNVKNGKLLTNGND